MNISNAVAPERRLPFVEEMKARAKAKAESAERKSRIESGTADAMESPRFAAPENKKSQARAKVQQLIEWLKIVRKLYAQDPKGMAKALAQVFKDLKSAVKAYRDAGGQEMSLSGAVAAPPPAAAPPSEAAAGHDPSDADAEAETGSPPDAPAVSGPEPAADPEKSAASDAASIYGAVVGEMRKAIGEDGLAFLKDVRGLVEELDKLLLTARGQATIRKRDKDTDEAFEDADKALKALHEEMDGMEQDIRRDAPTAGMKLSMAA